MSFYELSAEKKDYFYFQNKPVLETKTHFHSAVEFLFIQSGTAEAIIDGEKRILQSGDAAFSDGFSVHAYTLSKETVACVVVGAKEYFQPIFKAFGDRTPEKFFRFENFNLLSQLYGLCKKKRNHQACRYEAFAGSVKLLLSEIADTNPLSPKKQDKQTALVCDVLRYAENHLKESLSLPTIAAQIGYSHEHLSRILHRYLNENWKSYVNRLRVRKAEELLKLSPTSSVLEIAYDCGFDSPNTFYRAYKKEFGTSPRRIENNINF